MTSQYKPTVILLSAISCILSITGGLFIIVTYVKLPAIRNSTRRLVLCLTLADVLSAIGYLFSTVRYTIDSSKFNHSEFANETQWCVFQGVLTTYSSIVSFIITIIIAGHIFVTVVRHRESTGTTTWLVIFNIVSWLIPAIIVGIAVRFDAIGPGVSKVGATEPWCWIREHKKLWMWLAGKGLEIACYLLTTLTFMTLYFYIFLHRRRANHVETPLRTEDKLFLYAAWLVLFSIRCWGTARFILYEYANQTESTTYMKVLLHLQAFGDPAQGFCNFVLFCIADPNVRGRLLVCCRRGYGISELRNDNEDTEFTGGYQANNTETIADIEDSLVNSFRFQCH